VRYLSILILFFASSLAAAAEPQSVRPLDPTAAHILAQALARSPSVRAMVRELDASDVIIHFETCWNTLNGADGAMRFVARRAGRRYVRITIVSALPPNSRTAIFGHELQHALEIARSEAADVDAVRKLFEAKGYRTRGWSDVFETDAAQRVERAIRSELVSRNRQLTLEAEPVVKFDH
jgi:hypothetical protein